MDKKHIAVIQTVLIILFVGYTPWLADKDPRYVGISILGTVIVALSPIITEYMQKQTEERNVKRKNKAFIKQIQNFLSAKLKIEVKKVEPPKTEKGIVENYYLFIEANFSNNSRLEKDFLALLTLCNYYPEARGRESTIIYDDLTDLSRKIIPYERKISKKTKTFLNLYKCMIKESKNFQSLEEVITKKDEIRDEEYHELRLDFSNTYQLNMNFMVVDELNTQQEMLEALRYLINEGELDDYNITKDTIKRIYAELYAKGVEPTVFFLIGNKIPESLKDYMRRCPNFAIPLTSSRNVPGIESRRFSLWLFKPTEHYKSPDDFYEKKVEPAIRKEKKNSLIEIFPMDFINAFEKTVRQEKWTKDMVTCFETFNYFKTGLKYSTTPIFDIITKKGVKLKELLSIIPFNIYIPDIRPSERSFIFKNYQKIKEKLDVEELHDWARSDRDHKEISEAILSFGSPTYSTMDKNIIWGLDAKKNPSKKQVKDRFLHLSKEIVENARKHARIFAYAPNLV